MWGVMAKEPFASSKPSDTAYLGEPRVYKFSLGFGDECQALEGMYVVQGTADGLGLLDST